MKSMFVGLIYWTTFVCRVGSIVAGEEVTCSETILNAIENFTYVMDLYEPKDKSIYDCAPQIFRKAILECGNIEPVQKQLYPALVIGCYEVLSHVTKDVLAKSRRKYVDLKEAINHAPWYRLLIDIALEEISFASTLTTNHDSETTALHLSTHYRLHDIQRLLAIASIGINLTWCKLERYVNCPSKHMYGMSPLGVACANQDSTGVRILIEHCADILLKDNFGRTPLDMALESAVIDNSYDLLIAMLELQHLQRCALSMNWEDMYESISESVDKFTSESCGNRSSGSRTKCAHSLKNKVESLLKPNASHDSFADALSSDRTHNLFPIDVVDASQLTAELFIAHYVSRRRPVIVKGAAQHWQLATSSQWTWDALGGVYGHIDVSGGRIPYPEVFGEGGGDTTLNEFRQYMDTYEAALSSDHGFDWETHIPPFYVFDSEVLSKSHSLSGKDEVFFDHTLNRLPNEMSIILSDEISSIGKIAARQFFLGPRMSV
jgi:hypothetical protein